jgi:acyl-coenzyme A thioesterase PaaI-like protein
MKCKQTLIEKLKFSLLTSPRGCRFIFNAWPPFWGTGIKVIAISNDFREVELQLKLKFYNKNYLNTQFGGSLFAMTDPFFTFMVLKQLGPEYTVCDQSATIDFVTFGKNNVKATLNVTQKTLNDIKAKTSDGQKYLPCFECDLIDEKTDQLIAKLRRTLYVRKKKTTPP